MTSVCEIIPQSLASGEILFACGAAGGAAVLDGGVAAAEGTERAEGFARVPGVVASVGVAGTDVAGWSRGVVVGVDAPSRGSCASSGGSDGEEKMATW
jgi:phage-related minor tail protein